MKPMVLGNLSYGMYAIGVKDGSRPNACIVNTVLQISKATHKCVLFGQEVALTPLEFNILWYLCAHQGQVVSSEELFEAVWGEKFMDSNNTVMSHIARLREKMHEPSRRPKFIKTVWGVGYTIE